MTTYLAEEENGLPPGLHDEITKLFVGAVVTPELMIHIDTIANIFYWNNGHPDVKVAYWSEKRGVYGRDGTFIVFRFTCPTFSVDPVEIAMRVS